LQSAVATAVLDHNETAAPVDVSESGCDRLNTTFGAGLLVEHGNDDSQTRPPVALVHTSALQTCSGTPRAASPWGSDGEILLQPVLAVGARDVQMVVLGLVTPEAVGLQAANEIGNQPLRCLAIAQFVVPALAGQLLQFGEDLLRGVGVRPVRVELHARM